MTRSSSVATTLVVGLLAPILNGCVSDRYDYPARNAQVGRYQLAAGGGDAFFLHMIDTTTGRVWYLQQDVWREKSPDWVANKPSRAVRGESEGAAFLPPSMEDPAMASIKEFITGQDIDRSEPQWKSRLEKPPVATFDKDQNYFWNLETNQGYIKIRLMPDVAPMHVTSTIYLTLLGFYDDLIFRRIVSGFMALGGCPEGNGGGGPGYTYEGELDSNMVFDRPGLISMANAGPGTEGSQFFITFAPTPHLNGKHTIFGQVVAGMTTVRTLETFGSRSGLTETPMIIERATITLGIEDSTNEGGW